MLELTRRSFLSSAAPLLLPAQSAPPRPRRSESFFGVHLDLHPNPSDPALGRDVSDEMVQDFLAKVKPDFVQYDCEGHVGYLGYPSKVGTSAPHIVNDSLAVWHLCFASRSAVVQNRVRSRYSRRIVPISRSTNGCERGT